MYRTAVIRPLNAHHYLQGDFGRESEPHTHPYQVEWIRQNRELDENGFATDIAAMERTLEMVLEQIDNRLLNDLPFFHERQTSLENVARYLAERLDGELPQPGSRTEIKIWESATAWASYERDS